MRTLVQIEKGQLMMPGPSSTQSTCLSKYIVEAVSIKAWLYAACKLDPQKRVQRFQDTEQKIDNVLSSRLLRLPQRCIAALSTGLQGLDKVSFAQ
ncbi:hypothetical protein EPA93_34360 [Ktedonosporobacter rubrisoli]|uniref:Uncharacterized protein n=1 Tax=Ktedonosporobacter rubrisoli TaxID=2509675 RepID=A0A4P6JYA6_KTERU|nr:hypothetical protein [Ktedonosporobacter rubrisoli]QBD80779.1 hypothetical protein EPA93_34360 [Ktedonosporobacter rubrisoli]